MSEENTPPATTPEQVAPQQQGAQVFLDDRELRTVFVNGYMFQQGGEEVILDIGFNMLRPSPQGGNQPQVWFKLSDRLIMSYPTAKKLAMSLTQFVKRYEQQFGEIPLQPGQRR